LTDEPPQLPQSPEEPLPGLARVISHCLEKDPEQRFQSASDLGFALKGIDLT
jgi:serine/threonine protein kinase